MSDFTGRLIDAYREHLAKEPPQDAGGHPSIHVHEQVGAAWAEWDRSRLALRTVIAARLASAALDADAQGDPA